MNIPPTEQLRSLKDNHERLKGELKTLNRRAHLTPTEEERAREIKKEKLRTKDRIRVLMSRVSISS